MIYLEYCSPAAPPPPPPALKELKKKGKETKLHPWTKKTHTVGDDPLPLIIIMYIWQPFTYTDMQYNVGVHDFKW